MVLLREVENEEAEPITVSSSVLTFASCTGVMEEKVQYLAL